MDMTTELFDERKPATEVRNKEKGVELQNW